MSALVYVGNRGPAFRGRYNGVDYDFPTGKTVPISTPAAVHIFCYGLTDKTPALSRYGWMKTSNERDAAMERLGAFVFAEQPEAEVPDLTAEPVAMPPPVMVGTVGAEAVRAP